MPESFQMIQPFRQLQAQQPVPPPPPPPPPPPAQHPAVQQHQQSVLVHPSSAPPVVTPPTFLQQMPQPQQWQPTADQSPQNWPSFSGNISGLNTSGLSSFLDHAVGQHGGPSAPGTNSQMHTPEGRTDSRTSHTSDILTHVSQAMGQEL